MPHSVQPVTAENYTLTELLRHEDARAYGWHTTRPDGSGLSSCCWLVYLPGNDDRSIDDDENPSTGVFVVTGLLNNGTNDGILRVLIAEAHDPEADAAQPSTITNVTAQTLFDTGCDAATLPHVLRAVVTDIIHGQFSPFSGPVEQDTQREARHAAHFANLLARAEDARQGV